MGYTKDVTMIKSIMTEQAYTMNMEPTLFMGSFYIEKPCGDKDKNRYMQPIESYIFDGQCARRWTSTC